MRRMIASSARRLFRACLTIASLAILAPGAARSQPPHVPGARTPDLVELVRLDSTFHLDIRYAGTNNFLHRAVYAQARAFLQRPAAEALLRALSASFALEVCGGPEQLRRALERAGHHAFGLVLATSPRFLLLRYRGKAPAPAGRPPAVASLDVSILHGMILQGILGITEAMQAQKLHHDYVRSASEAVAAVIGGDSQAAFLMNAPTMEQVRMAPMSEPASGSDMEMENFTSPEISLGSQ